MRTKAKQALDSGVVSCLRRFCMFTTVKMAQFRGSKQKKRRNKNAWNAFLACTFQEKPATEMLKTLQD